MELQVSVWRWLRFPQPHLLQQVSVSFLHMLFHSLNWINAQAAGWPAQWNSMPGPPLSSGQERGCSNGLPIIFKYYPLQSQLHTGSISAKNRETSLGPFPGTRRCNKKPWGGAGELFLISYLQHWDPQLIRVCAACLSFHPFHRR